jgi:hypothetical protein
VTGIIDNIPLLAVDITAPLLRSLPRVALFNGLMLRHCGSLRGVTRSWAAQTGEFSYCSGPKAVLALQLRSRPCRWSALALVRPHLMLHSAMQLRSVHAMQLRAAMPTISYLMPRSAAQERLCQGS